MRVMTNTMKSKLSKLSRVIGIIAIAGIAVACASINHRSAKLLPVQPGSDIQINITADIPLNKARVYSQKGQLIAKSDIDKNDVFCSVLMNSVQKENATQLGILPGNFRVTNIRMSNNGYPAWRFFVSTESMYDRPSDINYETELRLQSIDQPEVRSLICVKQADGFGNHHPALLDFKNALGSLVEFNENMQHSN
jgi:hypothetical protein